jgi:hypothetical protein
LRTRTRITLAALVLGGALVGGVAWATIPGDNQVYNACMLKATGTIRLIDASLPSSSLLSHCTSIEKPITWNQKGEPGAAGAAGIAGAKGDAGAAGAAGPKGDVGAAGPPGAKGDNGAPGTNGINGTDGAQGPKGDPCLAADPACRGPKGDTGDVGPAGPPGAGATSMSLAALEGTPCGVAGGTQGAVRVVYTASLQADAIALTCSHPVNISFLDVYASTRQTSWDCGTFFSPNWCYGATGGTITVSPADVNGNTTCTTANNGSYGDSLFLCFLTFVQGTTVTVTATGGAFSGWGTPYGNHQPTECAGTTAPTCSITLSSHRSVLASFK